MPYLIRQQNFNTTPRQRQTRDPIPKFQLHTSASTKHSEQANIRICCYLLDDREMASVPLSALKISVLSGGNRGISNLSFVENSFPSEGNCYRLGVCDNWIVLRDGSRPKAVIFDDSIFPTARQPTLHDSSFKVEIGCGASSSKLGNARAVAT